jgi:hypothetical protein
MPFENLDPSAKQDIMDYLQLDESALYGLIPPHLSEYSGTMFMNEGQEKAGQKAFEDRLPPIRAKLCDEWKLCARMKDPSFDDGVKLVVMIGDVIATCAGGIPPFLAASLLVKIGLRRVCECK